MRPLGGYEFFLIHLLSIKFAFISALTIGFFFSNLSAEEISLVAEVNKNKVTVGEKIALILTLKSYNDKPLKLPVFTGEIGEFIIKDYQLLKRPITNSEVHIQSISYTLVGYVIGSHKIPSLEYKHKDITVRTLSIPITVESVLLANDNSLEPLKSNLDINGSLQWWAYPVLAIFAIIVFFLVQAIFKFIIRSRQKPYYETALLQLEKLKQELKHREINKTSYFKIDRIIKNFYSEFWRNQDILSMTLKQLKSFITKHPSAYDQFFIKFFSQADTIKFSNTHPNIEETNILLLEFQEILAMVKTKELTDKSNKKTKLSLTG